MTPGVIQAQDHFLELSGYIGGEGNEKVNAAAIHSTGNWEYMYVVGQSSSKKSWMPSGPRRGGVAPGCTPKRVAGNFTIQCGGIGARQNGFIARYTIAGEPSGFSFFGSSSGASEVTDIAVNDQGHIFIVGWTSEELTYGRNLYNGGQRDAFVARIDTTKFDPKDTGPELEESNSPVKWAKHIGGEGRDQALALAINQEGNPVVVGETTSEEFPTSGTESQNKTDGDGRFGIEEDEKKIEKNDKIKVKGKEKFLQQSNSNSYRGGSSDAFVTVVTKDGQTYRKSFFLGGDAKDIAKDVAVDGNTIYIAGSTKSNEVKSPWGTLHGGTGDGDKDAFLFQNTILPTQPDTGQLINNRSGNQVANGIDILKDNYDNKTIVLAGYAEQSYSSNNDGFVALYENITQSDGEPITYNEIGGNDNDRINALQVVNQDYASSSTINIVGTTESGNFSSRGELPEDVSRYSGGQDAFLMQMEDDAEDIEYMGLLGGKGSDRGLGLVVTKDNIFNALGTTSSGDFLFKRAPYSSLRGSSDGFISRLTPSDQRPTNLSLKAEVPQEFMMEEAPISYNLEIHNNENTDAKDVTLTGQIEGGSVASVPEKCTTSGSEDVRCSYDEISGHLMKTPEIKVQPLNAPRMVDVNFEVSTASREYKIEDNKLSDSTEVISKIDLQVDFIEVTQGIQDRRHSIPLIKDKTTYARVYVTATRQTVDSGVLQVDTGPFSAELTGRDKNGVITGSPIMPVDKAPASIRPVDGTIRGTSVSANLSDTLNGHQVIGRVAGGNDAFRYTGSTPSISLNNTSGADVEIYDENRIVITGEGKTGDTNYTIVVDSVLNQPNRSLIGHAVSKQTGDKINSARTKVTGKVGNGSDGITYRGELKRMELSNPSAADVLVEKGGVIVIESKGGGTEFTIDDTTKIDANTFDRNAKQAFDFRLPNEWVDGEQIELEARVNPNNSINESRGGLGNSKETETYELWHLAPVCMRTQAVRTSSNLPDPKLDDTEKGERILKFAETLLPANRIRIFPNYNEVTPGIFEAGGNFEFGDDPGEPPFYNENDHDGAKVNTLLYWRSLTGTSPDWCDNQGARTHWAGLIRESDYAGGPSGQAPTKRPFSKVLWFALRGDDNSDWNQIQSPMGGETLAHELGHNYGMGHINCPNPSSPGNARTSQPSMTESAPFPPCQLGPLGYDKFYGFDTRDPGSDESPNYSGQTGIHPNLPAVAPAVSPNISDLMSYANHSWTSSYTWMSFWNTFRSEHCSAVSESDSFFCTEPPASKTAPAYGRSSSTSLLQLELNREQRDGKGPNMENPLKKQGESYLAANRSIANSSEIDASAIPERVLVINGSININNKSTTRLRAVELPSRVLNTEDARELLNTGPKNPDFPVQVKLHDDEGRELSSTFVQLAGAAETAPAGKKHISLALPWNPEASRVEVTLRENKIGSDKLADSRPEVSIEAPAGGEHWDEETVMVKWSVSGVQNPDDVRYMIHYSPDEGESWHVMSTNETSEQFAIDPTEIPGSTNQALIRITGTYQGRTGTAVSKLFQVSGQRPYTQIQSPEKDGTYRAGGQAYLEGRAYDMDDGYLTGDNLQWRLTGPDGEQRDIGNGEELTIFNLSPGLYKVILTATDSDGMTSRETSQFVVQSSGEAYPDTTGLIMPEMQEKEETKDSDRNKKERQKSNEKVDRSDTGSTFTLKPKGGFSLPGVSSFGDITGLAGSSLQNQTSVFTWGASLTMGSRDGFANLRLSGLYRSKSTVSTLQNDQITTTEVDMSFSALSAELVLKPLPRIIVQPYAIAGYGARKLSFDGGSGSDIDQSWKQTVPIGAGVDIPLGGKGVVLGVEMVDYISNFSGEGTKRHDAFLLGYIGIPL